MVRAAGPVNALCRNMLTMLMERNRMGYLPLLKDAYTNLVDEKEGRVKGILWSAFPMDDAMKAKIEAVLKERMKKDVILTVMEDKSLIGGIKLNIQGTIIDGSLKRQLEALKENILKE